MYKHRRLRWRIIIFTPIIMSVFPILVIVTKAPIFAIAFAFMVLIKLHYIIGVLWLSLVVVNIVIDKKIDDFNTYHPPGYFFLLCLTVINIFYWESLI